MRYLSCIFIVSSIFTLPSDPNTVRGAVTFSPTEAGTVHLEISTASAISEVNWQSFSIDNGQTVTFIGPDSEYHFINRVIGTERSVHNGDIFSNNSFGNIYLINQNGITIGASASTTVGALIATTLDLPSFSLNSDLTFEGTSLEPISIAGTITTTSGDVVVMANKVIHSGSITAVEGARIASGHKILLKQSSLGGERIFIQPSSSSPAGPTAGVGVDISGRIEALETEIKANGNLYSLAINVSNSASIQASGCTTQDGRILLQADSLGTSVGVVSIDNATVGVDNSGCSTGYGPTIQILGPTITIANSSKIDASGNIGGGIINIYDRDTNLQNQPSLTISTDSTSQLLANACLSGDGGTQTFWSDSSTLSSTFEARPLLGTGSGGSITSTSVNRLDYNAQTTDLSPHSIGNFGTLVLNAPNMNAGSSDLGAVGSQVFQSSLNNALDRANVTLNATSGNLSIIEHMIWTSTTTLNLIAADVLIGLSNHSHSYPAGFSGANATIIGSVENSFGIYAGAGADNNAVLLAPSVSIDSQSSGNATLTVEASSCCDAFIDTTSGSANIGQTVQMNSMYVNAGCCNYANIAYVGSKTGSSNIAISTSEIIEINGGTGIADNTSSIEAFTGGSIDLATKNLHVLAGSDPSKSGNYNHAYIYTTGAITYNGTNLNIKGAQEGLSSSKGYLQGSQIQANLAGSLQITGGTKPSNQAYILSDGDISISTVDNLMITGGQDFNADAFIKSNNGNITIDNPQLGTGSLIITVPTSGACNAQAFLETNNGDIDIGQSYPYDTIILNAGACGLTPVAYVGVTGSGNIRGHALRQMSLYGGGVSQEASHAAVFTKNGHITIHSELDLNVIAGTGVNAHAYVEAVNGNISVSVGRNARMEGSCTIPNYAYIQTKSDSRVLSANVENNLYLVGNAYLHSQNKHVIIGGQRLVVGCSTPINPVGPVGPVSPCINTAIPSQCYFQYAFLYELFYRMRYFYPYPFFEGPYFDYANYVSP